MGLQLGAQALPRSVICIEIGDVAMVDPLHHLMGTELLSPRTSTKNFSRPARSRSSRFCLPAVGADFGSGWMAGTVRPRSRHYSQRETTSVAAKK
jgi:hypothetical protein